MWPVSMGEVNDRPAVGAVASSVDGRGFTLEAALEGLELRPGSYVSLRGRLGQVYALRHATNQRGVVHGEGVLIDEGTSPFAAAAVEPAAVDDVAAWLDRSTGSRAALDVGELALEPGVRFPLDAGGFNRHTFLCGQSGSGKTYALGTILEQLVLHTSLRIVVLDPNSDFVRLADVRPDVDGDLAATYRDAVSGLAVRRAGAAGDERLHVRFTDCDAQEQAAILRLDPIADREEYGTLLDLLEEGLQDPNASAQAIAQRLLAAEDPSVRALGTRLRSLGIDQWSIWSVGDRGSLQDLAAGDGPRLLVVDLGSLGTQGEMAVAAETLLAALWRRRSDREPVLIVIDEAHNVCPREPGDEVSALASELTARIAAEGRKFGLYLLVSTQRPFRVNELVVSQCDNLVMMRMTSAGDLAYVADLLSFAPRPLLEEATSFRMGESLVAGKIAPHPTFVRFGPRIAEEGGADVPTTWARRAS